MTEPQTLAELVARVRAAPIQPTEAPATPIAGASVATYEPGTVTELVGSREIAAVAGKLAKNKSENKQSVGRAMLRAIRGEVWAPAGARNGTMYQIAAELIEAYPNLDPGSVCEAFSAAISNLNDNHEQSGAPFTEEILYGQLERVQAERQNKLNMIASLGGLVSDAPPVWTAPPEGAPVDTRAAELNAAGFDTLIVLVGAGTYYLRTPDRGTFDWRLLSEKALTTKVINLFGRENGTVITHQDGEFVGVSKLCEVYARMADKVVYDYRSPSTTFDLATCTLHVGLPAETPEPRENVHVAAWLQELAGGTPEDLTELYDWIASTTREYIDRPAAALVISGAKDAGKSLFALAMAGTWGVLPVPLANAVERFNGALLSSPFWHADERMPEEMTEACFRETVPARSRLIEPKGQEKAELHGCGRLMFTLNSVEDLHVGTSRGPDAVDAVAGRIAYFDCSARKAQVLAAQAPLRLPLSFDLDLPAMIGHLRYVQTTVRPREQRFLGARLNNATARAVVMNASVKHSVELIDGICGYLADPLTWEKTYRAGLQWAVPGNNFPIVTRGGKLYVWTSEFAARMHVREFRKIDTLLCGGRVRLRFAGTQNSYREIDLERFLDVCPDALPDLVKTCSVDTHERLGLTAG